MSETLTAAALPRSWRSRVVLAVSPTLNVAALVLALIALPRKDHLVAARFEIVDLSDRVFEDTLVQVFRGHLLGVPPWIHS